MYPWHKLVCDELHRGDLPEATIDFVEEAKRSRGRITQRRELQDVPDRVLRLIETKRRRQPVDNNDITAYVDFAYYEEDSKDGTIGRGGSFETEPEDDDPAGLIVFEDGRK
jgi:hypothetical protein